MQLCLYVLRAVEDHFVHVLFLVHRKALIYLILSPSWAYKSPPTVKTSSVPAYTPHVSLSFTSILNYIHSAGLLLGLTMASEKVAWIGLGNIGRVIQPSLCADVY